MLQEFTLNRGRAIINFTSKYCDNRRKILTSYAYSRVVESFIAHLRRDNPVIYEAFIQGFRDEDELIRDFMEVIRLLSVCSVEEILEEEVTVLEERGILIIYLEDLFDAADAQ